VTDPSNSPQGHSAKGTAQTANAAKPAAPGRGMGSGAIIARPHPVNNAGTVQDDTRSPSSARSCSGAAADVPRHSALSGDVTVVGAPLVVAGVVLRAAAAGFLAELRSAAARRPRRGRSRRRPIPLLPVHRSERRQRSRLRRTRRRDSPSEPRSRTRHRISASVSAGSALSRCALRSRWRRGAGRAPSVARPTDRRQGG